MCEKERQLIYDLLSVMCSAINDGDWKVDGACDPDAVIHRAAIALINEGMTEPYSAMRYAFTHNMRSDV